METPRCQDCALYIRCERDTNEGCEEFVAETESSRDGR